MRGQGWDGMEEEEEVRGRGENMGVLGDGGTWEECSRICWRVLWTMSPASGERSVMSVLFSIKSALPFMQNFEVSMEGTSYSLSTHRRKPKTSSRDQL